MSASGSHYLGGKYKKELNIGSNFRIITETAMSNVMETHTWQLGGGTGFLPHGVLS